MIPGTISGSYLIIIFPENYIQNPMQLVFLFEDSLKAFQGVHKSAHFSILEIRRITSTPF